MKQIIRNEYKRKRQQLSPQVVLEKSHRITQHLFTLPQWQQSQRIMAYLSFQQEVITHSLYDEGWAEQKTMLIPICQPQTKQMEASVLTEWTQLALNAYGIRELPPHLVCAVPHATIDLCIIPGIAFDYEGNRIGFGAGYYDRFLSQLSPKAIKIALAFSEQLSSQPLPQDPFDLPMDLILTDEGLITPKKNKG